MKLSCPEATGLITAARCRPHHRITSWNCPPFLLKPWSVIRQSQNDTKVTAALTASICHQMMTPSLLLYCAGWERMTHTLGIGMPQCSLSFSSFVSNFFHVFFFFFYLPPRRWKDEGYYLLILLVSQRRKWEGSCVSVWAHKPLGVEEVTEQLSVWACVCRKQVADYIPGRDCGCGFMSDSIGLWWRDYSSAECELRVSAVLSFHHITAHTPLCADTCLCVRDRER